MTVIIIIIVIVIIYNSTRKKGEAKVHVPNSIWGQLFNGLLNAIRAMIGL